MKKEFLSIRDQLTQELDDIKKAKEENEQMIASLQLKLELGGQKQDDERVKDLEEVLRAKEADLAAKADKMQEQEERISELLSEVERIKKSQANHEEIISQAKEESRALLASQADELHKARVELELICKGTEDLTRV